MRNSRRISANGFSFVSPTSAEMLVRLVRRVLSALVAIFSIVAISSAHAAELVTLEMETQTLDLDSFAVLPLELGDLQENSGADIKLAYNGDRTTHAVVFPVSAGVEIAVVHDLGFDGVTSLDVVNLVFSPEPIDVALTPNNCVVIRTDQGALYKIGNASEIGFSVTFNYSTL